MAASGAGAPERAAGVLAPITPPRPASAIGRKRGRRSFVYRPNHLCRGRILCVPGRPMKMSAAGNFVGVAICRRCHNTAPRRKYGRNIRATGNCARAKVPPHTHSHKARPADRRGSVSAPLACQAPIIVLRPRAPYKRRRPNLLARKSSASKRPSESKCPSPSPMTLALGRLVSAPTRAFH